MASNSYLTLHTPLDSLVRRDLKFHVQSLSGSEGICKEYCYKLKISSLERLSSDDAEELSGKPVTVNIAYRDKKGAVQHRYIHGLVYHLTELGLNRAPLVPDIWQYEMEISSWLRKLEFIKDCRIFQKSGNNSIKIIGELLRDYGFHDFRSHVSKRLPVREFSVLYNETIVNYINRLLLEDGLIWYYEHHKNKHVLVIEETSLNLPKLPLEMIPDRDAIRSFNKQAHHLPVATYSRGSFDWQNQPAKQIERPVPGNKKIVNHFEYVPNFKNTAEGEEKVSIQRDRLAAEAEGYRGESTIRALISGNRFLLHAPALPDFSGKYYLLKSLQIEATQSSYRNFFTALPANKPFHLPENKGIEIPRIWGPQTATVTGEGGNGYVRTQEQACVKVRFHWDYLTPKDAKHTSAYIRVAMPGAGNHRGMLFIPRIGDEVVVGFEQGDPSKPVILGSTYSRQNPPPIQPNSKPFKSIIRNSPDRDSNQLVFDDAPGKENLEWVAKKDMNIDVSHDCNIEVENNIHIKARSVFVVMKDSINVVAGSNIENQSLATIINLPLAACFNTACVNILDLALGVVMNRAGGLVSQMAGGVIANTSALGIVQASENMIKNTSQALLLNTASAVINSGGESVKTKAGLAILNSASEKINNESEKKTNDATLISMAEAKNASVKGKTIIGP